MADGHHGYNASIGYPSYFFREMGPDWLDFCIRIQGFDANRTGASYRYLDLGCGPGFHLCLLAAANPQAEFVGIDFEPDYIAHGESLAAAGGLTNITFVQADFLELAGTWRTELGLFDYVVLQGILSWISPELRSAAIQCVAHASKRGTAVAFGYNTPPGWLSAVPLQHVAHELARRVDDDAAVASSIVMFRKLKGANAQLFAQMSRFGEQLEQLAVQPRGYLAHELLTDHWTPLWGSTVTRTLDHAGFTYVGSATIPEALLPDALPDELRAIVAGQTDELLRRDLQDIIVMTQFRRDIFCRDPRRSDTAALEPEMPVYLISAPPEGVPVRFKTTIGGLTVDYAAVADIVAALADGPRPVAELMALQNPARPDTRSILLSMLDGHMLMVGSANPFRVDIAHRFNAAVARAVADGRAYFHVAAAALGSALRVTDLDLLFLDTWLSADGDSDEAALAEGVAHRLKNLGRELKFRGEPISDQQLQAQVGRLAGVFVDQRVPQWRTLGVIE
jgi:SAM-dependent methyltransferase